MWQILGRLFNLRHLDVADLSNDHGYERTDAYDGLQSFRPDLSSMSLTGSMEPALVRSLFRSASLARLTSLSINNFLVRREEIRELRDEFHRQHGKVSRFDKSWLRQHKGAFADLVTSALQFGSLRSLLLLAEPGISLRSLTSKMCCPRNRRQFSFFALAVIVATYIRCASIIKANRRTLRILNIEHGPSVDTGRSGHVFSTLPLSRLFYIIIYPELTSKPWHSLRRVELRGVESWEDYGHHHHHHHHDLRPVRPLSSDTIAKIEAAVGTNTELVVSYDARPFDYVDIEDI